MPSKAVIIAVIATAVPTLAFTNGTLVPAYLCNPQPDGLPKSFAQVLTFTKEPTAQVGFSKDAKQNVKAPALAKQDNSQIGNSAYILASLHDSPNSLTSVNQGIQVKTANGGPLVAGKANKLVLSSGGANVPLKGAVLVGQDAAGTRQGSFTDTGNTFIAFPGCGKNPQGQISGVIQQTGVSATGTYSTLEYNAPACVNGGNLTLAGLSVTGKGFGTWSQVFQITGSNCNGQNGGDNNNGQNAQGGANAAKGAKDPKAEKGATQGAAQTGGGAQTANGAKASHGAQAGGARGHTHDQQGQNGEQQGKRQRQPDGAGNDGKPCAKGQRKRRML